MDKCVLKLTSQNEELDGLRVVILEYNVNPAGDALVKLEELPLAFTWPPDRLEIIQH